jgi:hypothetical protein
MKRKSTTTLPGLLLCILLPLTSTSLAVADTGQVDLAPLSASIDARPKINLNFGPAMMAGFAETLRQSKPDLADILGSITGLRMMVFENVDSRLAEPQILSLIDQLDYDGWTPAIKVQDGDTLVDLYLNESGQFVKGLVLLVRDGTDTVVLANIHGDLDAVGIGKLFGSGNIFSGVDLSGLMSHLEGHDQD